MKLSEALIYLEKGHNIRHGEFELSKKGAGVSIKGPLLLRGMGLLNTLLDNEWSVMVNGSWLDRIFGE